MAASNTDGPVYTFGDLAKLTAAFGGVVPDPNPDAGPSLTYQADGFIDPRFWFAKDKVQGYTGSVPGHLDLPFIQSARGVPAALASNNIAAAQVVTTGVAMTLASASVGVTLNVPIHTFAAWINSGAVVTAAIALDFGFAFGNCTSGSTTIPVADGRNFAIGMPLVIGGVGNSGGTASLLTIVTAVVASAGTNTITVANAPLATNATAPIGFGDIWTLQGPNLVSTPLAAQPWIAKGTSLVFDARQGIARGVQIVGTVSATGGTFTVRGYDIWGVPMSQTITVAAGASTGWSTKCFKYISSVTPNFTDATHNYTVGTSDVFDFHYRNVRWEDTDVSWAGTYVTNSTGWVGADTTAIATALTNDTCGTTQVSASGGGSPVTGAAASNGTVSSLAMSGRWLAMGQFLAINDVLRATADDQTALFGSIQA